MNRFAIHVRLGLRLGVAAALALGGRALADDGLPPMPPAMDPSGALTPTSVVQGAGIKIGEGTVFRPQLGIETGVVSNVFYESQGPVTAGLLRILFEIGTGSLPYQRLSARSTGNDQDPSTQQAYTATSTGDFQYSADLYASWDQYLSQNNRVQDQSGLGGGILLRGLVNPQGALQLGIQEHFNRMIRATNFESNDSTNRDVNILSLRLSYAPIGRSLGGYLYYTNTIDVFERSQQQFANRLQNVVGLRVNWQWLPLTRVFGDVSAGYYTGLGDSQKVDSYPFTAVTGLQTALTLNTTFSVHAGYTNGFYASGPSYSSLTGGALFGYRYSPLGRVTALYNYVHSDSINANFYRDHLFQLAFTQYFVPFVVVATPELRLRQYNGTIVPGTEGGGMTGTTRNDLIFGAIVGMRYSFRNWIAATLDYELSVVNTDFRYVAESNMPIDPSYVRHELLLGVRAAY
jgi:hypothetical protein